MLSFVFCWFRRLSVSQSVFADGCLQRHAETAEARTTGQGPLTSNIQPQRNGMQLQPPTLALFCLAFLCHSYPKGAILEKPSEARRGGTVWKDENENQKKRRRQKTKTRNEGEREEA